jgi:hypothetical protein
MAVPATLTTAFRLRQRFVRRGRHGEALHRDMLDRRRQQALDAAQQIAIAR